MTGPQRPDRGPADRLPPAPDGLLIVDKPSGWTSHDVVARSRGICHTRKIGHAGTLDPMATGVLVLGVGRATRLLTYLVGCDKTYTATIRLGQSTITDDAWGPPVEGVPGALQAGEGEVTSGADAGHVTREAIDAAVATLTGDILQRPSAVSAIKVDGQRSYARVRAGEDVELAARPVTVSDFDVVCVTPVDLAPEAEASRGGIRVLDVDVVVSVSSGTYVRALARDLGGALGVGGHLTALRRTRVGRFTLTDAHPLQGLMDAARTGADAPVIPLAEAAAAAFPVRRVTDFEARALGHGKRIPREGAARDGVVAAIASDGRLVALLDETGDTARTAVVFAPATS